jgi:hypothetical protein
MTELSPVSSVTSNWRPNLWPKFSVWVTSVWVSLSLVRALRGRAERWNEVHANNKAMHVVQAPPSLWLIFSLSLWFPLLSRPQLSPSSQHRLPSKPLCLHCKSLENWFFLTATICCFRYRTLQGPINPAPSWLASFVDLRAFFSIQ